MSKSKNKKKSSQMVLRVEKHEKAQFQDICESLDTSAARELRRFMRDFVAANTPAPEAEIVAANSEVSTADVAAIEPTVAQPVEVDAILGGAQDAKAKKVNCSVK